MNPPAVGHTGCATSAQAGLSLSLTLSRVQACTSGETEPGAGSLRSYEDVMCYDLGTPAGRLLMIGQAVREGYS